MACCEASGHRRSPPRQAWHAHGGDDPMLATPRQRVVFHASRPVPGKLLEGNGQGIRAPSEDWQVARLGAARGRWLPRPKECWPPGTELVQHVLARRSGNDPGLGGHTLRIPGGLDRCHDWVCGCPLDVTLCGAHLYGEGPLAASPGNSAPLTAQGGKHWQGPRRLARPLPQAEPVRGGTHCSQPGEPR